MNVVPSVIVINNIHHHRFRRRANRNAFRVSGEACGFYLMCPEHPSEGLDKPSLMRLLTASPRWSQGTLLGEISHLWGALCQVTDHVASSGRSGEKSRAPLIWGKKKIQKNPLSRYTIVSTSLWRPPTWCVPWKQAGTRPCVFT